MRCGAENPEPFLDRRVSPKDWAILNKNYSNPLSCRTDRAAHTSDTATDYYELGFQIDCSHLASCCDVVNQNGSILQGQLAKSSAS